MNRVQVSENLSLSTIIQGFWRLDSWNMTPQELAEMMHACIERGVTTFDTAQIYGGSEEKMGEAFALDPSIRGQIELVSKTGISKAQINGETFVYYDTTKENILRSCKESLQKMGVDHLDLYLIHREDPMLDPWETAEALLELKKEGLVREIGVSNFDPYKFDALNEACGGELVTNQIEWNPMCYEHFNSGMIDHLTCKKIHPMIWSPLAGGGLFTREDEQTLRVRAKIEEIAMRHDTDPAVIVYAWILAHPVGAMPLVGSRKADRLDLAIRALDVKLERWEWFEIWKAAGQPIR